MIVDKLVGLKPSGNTALFDACYVGLDKLQHGRHSKRVLLLISDGRDNTSRYSFANLRELLREMGFYFTHSTSQAGRNLKVH